jgi:glucan phosphoethanolaminetransferase (alkaline phosphatase superfamily)
MDAIGYIFAIAFDLLAGWLSTDYSWGPVLAIMGFFDLLSFVFMLLFRIFDSKKKF